jgi:hypothetical protein
MVSVKTTQAVSVEVQAQGDDAVIVLNGSPVLKLTEDSAALGKVRVIRLPQDLGTLNPAISNDTDRIKVSNT